MEDDDEEGYGGNSEIQAYSAEDSKSHHSQVSSRKGSDDEHHVDNIVQDNGANVDQQTVFEVSPEASPDKQMTSG